MGIRETLNDRPKITTGLTAAILVIMVVFLFWPGGRLPVGSNSAKVFFTIDDGKSYFPDEATKVPPFQKDGKDVVRAFVWRCGDGKPFVGHLMRYTPDAKKKVEQIYGAKGKSVDPGLMEGIQASGVEIKAPGSDKWLKQADPASTAVRTPKCPAGDAQPVDP